MKTNTHEVIAIVKAIANSIQRDSLSSPYVIALCVLDLIKGD